MTNTITQKSIQLNWKPFTLKDAYEDRPPIQYLAGNIFEIPSLNVVYGAPGSLKSLLLADLAVCVASGHTWLSPYVTGMHYSFPVTQGPVVWLDFDNGVRRTHDRFSALGKARNLPYKTPLFYYSMPEPIFDAGHKKQVEEVAKIIKKHKAILVIIDNLGIISGGADENSCSMIPVLSNLRRLEETTRAVIIVIHHRRKSNNKYIRAGDNLRGHSSIESALDLVLQIDRNKKSDTISIQSTKERGCDVPILSAVFKYKTDSKRQLLEARFYSVENNRDLGDAMIWKVIYQSAGENPINKTMLTDKAYSVLKNGNGKNHIGRNRVGENIDRMVKDGFLILTPGTKNNAQLFTRNPEKAGNLAIYLQ
jgi:hypothetical protein